MHRRTGGASSSGQNVLDGYIFIRTLGRGSFAKVKLALHILTKLEVAVKIIDLESIGNSEVDNVRREINILQRLCHPHVVRLFEVKETPSKVYIVMEYMRSGELFQYIANNKLHEDEARRLFQQIILGVEHCHQNMVVHRDLKPENLLLDSRGDVKIADFGLGNIMRDGYFLKTSCGSPNYAAPEVISGQPYAGPEVDVWSCGIILYTLLCGRLPFEDENIPVLFAKIQRGVYPTANHWSESARDLISRILVVDPMRRISIPEIRSHPWFQKHLPLHIAYPSAGAFNRSKKVDIDVIREMFLMGFDPVEVIVSLMYHLQNKATVVYSMVLHSRSPAHVSHLNEILENLECMDLLQPDIQSESSGQRNWSIGFKTRASAREVMMGVLTVFHCLNVRWEEIGQYNMKCLWLPSLSRCSSSAEIPTGPADPVKFEMQLYKASAGIYTVDVQQTSGNPFHFLEICSAFRALLE